MATQNETNQASIELMVNIAFIAKIIELLQEQA